MELTIGIRDHAAPLTIDVEYTKEELKTKLTAALNLKEVGVLELSSTDGTLTFIPVSSLGYLKLAEEDQRRVGFGFI